MGVLGERDRIAARSAVGKQFGSDFRRWTRREMRIESIGIQLKGFSLEPASLCWQGWRSTYVRESVTTRVPIVATAVAEAIAIP